MQDLINIIAASLKTIESPRYFNSERGFQGQFHAALENQLRSAELIPNNAIIEDEYQKTLQNHGIRYRPDLLVHIPFELGVFRNRREGNIVIFELKRKANKMDAIDRFIKLNYYIRELNYPLAFFINIDDRRSFVQFVPDNRIHVFNVIKENEKTKVFHSYLSNESIQTQEF